MHSGFSGRFRCCVGPDCSAAHETRSAVGHREELGALHRFRPQPRSVLMLHDKARLHVSAVKHGWPVPNGMMPRGRADLTRIASLRPPMILKPADRHHFHDRRAPHLVLAENCRSAVTAAERLLPLAGGVEVFCAFSAVAVRRPRRTRYRSRRTSCSYPARGESR
jgi:hypothetical protein